MFGAGLRRLSLSVFCALLSLSLSSNTRIDQPLDIITLATVLSSQQFVRGRFIQQNKILGIAKPIETTGRFLYAHGHGLLWNIETPISFHTLYTKKKPDTYVTSQQIVGKRPNVVGRASELIINLLDGKGINDKNFTVELAGTSDRWSLSLVPRRVLVRRHIAKIEMKGSSYISEIDLTLDDSSSTSIKFHDVNPVFKPSSVECQQLLMFESPCPQSKQGY